LRLWLCLALAPVCARISPGARAVFHARVFLSSFVKDEAATRAKTLLAPECFGLDGERKTPNSPPPRPDVTPGCVLDCGLGVSWCGLVLVRAYITAMRSQ
jgi:hypothetical protein